MLYIISILSTERLGLKSEAKQCSSALNLQFF